MIQASYTFEQPVLPTGTTLQTKVLLKFRADRPETPRRDLNLSLVIDRSGSMAGYPLHHALEAAAAVVDQLNETDRLSVVVYDDLVTTVIPSQAVIDREHLKNQIRRVRAGGLTNLSGGWLKGCEQVKSEFDANKINRVLLLTDGHANMGIQDPRVLTSTSAQKAEEGIITTTLGFDQGFNEDLLISMARAAQGNFYFIQSIDDAADVFGIELESLRAVVGQNLQVTIALAPGVKLLDTLSLAQVSQNSQGETLINLGELYENEDKLLGLSLEVDAGKVGSQPLMTLSYNADVIEKEVIQNISGQSTVEATIGTIDEAAQAVGSEITLELTYLTIAKAKETALTLAEQGNHTAAEQILRSLIQQLRDRGLNENFEIAEEIDQLVYFADRIAQKALGNSGRKELLDQSFQSLSRNRTDLSARGVTAGEEVYSMPTVSEVGTGIELYCIREGGKLRIKIATDGYDQTKNVQFPRAIRAEGARYVVEVLETSADASFYRVKGNITRLSLAGEADQFVARRVRSIGSSSGKASKGPASAADLPTTDTIGNGILVQCVKDGSKLRARVVSDGYEPNWNMRFPRSVREENMLYVVDEIKVGPDGKSYIACGEVKRFVQPSSVSA